MTGDLFHRGHLELIKKAKALGDYLIIGLHPDDVAKKYKREPIISYEDRKKIIESIKEVDKVVEDCMDFRKPTMFSNIWEYKVNVVVHGDDYLPRLYDKVKRNEFHEVIQVEYYPHISTTKIIQKTKGLKNLKTIVEKRKAVIVSAGDAITAKLIEEAGYDGIWVSGFETSARLGLKDNGSITMTEMLLASKTIVDATSLPVIVDVDNGYGGLDSFIRTVQEFEKIGCAGVCVEDNVFPKQNSLWGGKVPLLPMEEFGKKIRKGKEAQKDSAFTIVARTEALIRGYGLKEAIKRSNHYINCGADMVLMHTREETGQESLSVPKQFESRVPLVIIPTKFPQIKNKQLFDAGYSVIVLANQTERVKIKAIREALKIMKENDCADPIEKGLSVTLDDMKNLT
jgi:phosphoenolpyruvate phosphomutase